MGGFRWSSLQDLFAIQEKMNRLFEDTINRSEFADEGLDAALWSPAADVYETTEEVVLFVELPGVRLEDVHLEAFDGKLRVSGVRRSDEGVEPRQFIRMERIYGTFSRDFAVPATLDPSRIKATLKAGILRVAAPKAERVQPAQLELRKAK
ncbi:MAG: Hsp20/alpha crystallin family protein [Acidobacteriota bacterium]